MTGTTEMLEIEAKLSDLFRSGDIGKPEVQAEMDALFGRHLELFREEQSAKRAALNAKMSPEAQAEWAAAEYAARMADHKDVREGRIYAGEARARGLRRLAQAGLTPAEAQPLIIEHVARMQQPTSQAA